jgi:hypothetical protein
MLRDGAKAVLLDPGRWCVVGGIVLWLCAWWLQLHAILWRPLREGLFGSMYMINFPGPKVFATPPFLYAYYYYSGGDAAISQLEATALGLMSIWLVTASVVDRRISGRLRNWTRWVATIAVAAPIGATMGMEGLLSRSPTVCHAFIVIFCEVPATVLLYIYLARVAAVFGGPAKTLARVGVAVPFVAGIPMVALVFAVKLAKWRMWPGTALLAGADAVLAVSVAIVAWSAVSRLGLKLAFGGEKREPVADAGT